MAKRKHVSEVPFSADMLPHNRKELWLDVVKLHYLELIIIGMVMFVFAMPMILNMLATDVYTAEMSGQLSETAPREQYMAVLESVSAAQITSAAVNIPLFAIFAIGLSGLLRITRQYAWGEVVTPTHDFVVGIKQNIKQTVCLAGITGIVYAACQYISYLAKINENPVAHSVSSACIMLAVFFLLPVGAYMLVCIPVYNNTFAQNFVQGFALYMKAPVKTLVGLMGFGGLFLLFLIPNTVVHFALTVLLVLGSPFLLLGWFLFTYNQMDRFINNEKHPELVNKGLYIPEEHKDV